MGYIYIYREQRARDAKIEEIESISRNTFLREYLRSTIVYPDPEIVPSLCSRNLVHIRRPTDEEKFARFEPFHDRFRAHLDRHRATLSTIELTRNNISRPLLTVPASLSEATSFIKLNNGFPLLAGWAISPLRAFPFLPPLKIIPQRASFAPLSLSREREIFHARTRRSQQTFHALPTAPSRG